jgi:hypothetical protein
VEERDDLVLSSTYHRVLAAYTLPTHFFDEQGRSSITHIAARYRAMKKSFTLRFSLTLFAALVVNIGIILALRALRQNNRLAALLAFSSILLSITQLLLRLLFRPQSRLYERQTERIMSTPVLPETHKVSRVIKIVVTGFVVMGILVGTFFYYSSQETFFFAIIDTIVVLILAGSIFIVTVSTMKLLLKARRPV